MKARGVPGTVLAVTRDYISVACGEDALQIQQLQRPGARRQMCAEFIAAHPIEVGRVLPFPE
jgi:methionyl-tRNA formyltransferase